MFKLFKKFFQKEPEVVEEVSRENLQDWLKKETASLNFGPYILTHLKQIEDIKLQLKEKVKILQEQEISETDQKQVEERVKNIVIGHKGHYAKEINQFIQKVSTPETQHFTTIKDYKEVISLNQNLDQEIEQLAKRTAKSYQAAQHLFFDNVESLFKLLGELNKIVKEFDKKVKDDKIEELEKVQESISDLNNEIEKRKNLEKEIKIKKDKLKTTNEKKDAEEQNYNNLIASKEHQEYLKLKDEETKLTKQIKDVEYEIFSFFSKLSKPLKKYERIALDNKIIKSYLDDSVKAFKCDEDLGILLSLSSLKKSLESLQFAEKQKNNFLKLIEKSESGCLQELSVKIRKLEEEKHKLNKKIEISKIVSEIEDKKKKISSLNFKKENIKTELGKLQSTFNKIDLEKNKNEIVEKVKEVLGKKVEIINKSRNL